MVIVTPPDSAACQHWEALMQTAAQQVDTELTNMREKERQLVTQHYALLSQTTTYTSPMYGWTNSYFAQKAKQTEQILKQLDRLYVTIYQTKGALQTPHFFNQRKALFLQLNRALNGMMEKEMFGQATPANRLKNQLGISTKATLHQWKMQGGADSIKGFGDNYRKITQASKNFARLGYMAIGLDIIGGVSNIREACSLKPESEPCTKSLYTEPPKVAGSIGGGMITGSVGSYLACNILFGLETLGTSFLWCSVVAGAVSGYGGAKLGGYALESTGEIIYKAQK